MLCVLYYYAHHISVLYLSICLNYLCKDSKKIETEYNYLYFLFLIINNLVSKRYVNDRHNTKNYFSRSLASVTKKRLIL